MKTHTASLINAVSLIIISLWGYFASDSPSFTALIPLVFGILLLSTFGGLKRENKTTAHIAVLLTVILFISLFKPLSGTLARNDAIGTLRVAIMMATTLLALAWFVKSFIAARRRN